MAFRYYGNFTEEGKGNRESFKSQFGMRAVMMFCRDYFGPLTSVKIYKRFGSGAVDMIKANPYLLCDEISGIGFEKADAVARSLGILRIQGRESLPE